jgi:hypothetical protein
MNGGQRAHPIIRFHHSLSARALAIINETRRHARVDHARQAIFHIIRERVTVAPGHVAVGVVGVIGDGVLVREVGVGVGIRSGGG